MLCFDLNVSGCLLRLLLRLQVLNSVLDFVLSVAEAVQLASVWAHGALDCGLFG